MLVGDGSERAALLRRIEELGLHETVQLLGTRYDVPALLARAAAFCLPSRAEGLSNAIMEAMAARLPVVATRAGGNPELVADGATGFVVPVGDAAAMADRLAILLCAGDGASTLVRMARFGLALPIASCRAPTPNASIETSTKCADHATSF